MEIVRRKVEVPMPILIIAAILIIALAIVAVQGDSSNALAGTVAQQTSSNLDINAFVAKINASRTSPLTINSTLMTAAQNRANDKAAGSAGDSATYVTALGYSYLNLSGYTASSSTNMNADQLFNVWKTKGELFNTLYKEVGVGVKQSSGGTWNFVIILANPEQTSAPNTNIGNAGTWESQQLDIVNLVNQARAAAGLCPLTIKPQLTSAAQRQADDMSSHNFLGHTGTDGSDVWRRIADTGYPATYAGENVLSRSNVNAAGAFDQWWNSPEHKANMMNGNFVEVGVALAGPSSQGKYYYAMVLASRGGGGCAELNTGAAPAASSSSQTTTDGGTTGGTTDGGSGGGTTGGTDTGGTDGGEQPSDEGSFDSGSFDSGSGGELEPQ